MKKIKNIRKELRRHLENKRRQIMDADNVYVDHNILELVMVDKKNFKLNRKFEGREQSPPSK